MDLPAGVEWEQIRPGPARPDVPGGDRLLASAVIQKCEMPFIHRDCTTSVYSFEVVAICEIQGTKSSHIA